MSLDAPIPIYDARGRAYPYSYSTGAQLYTVPQDSQQRECPPWLDNDIARLLSRVKHRQLLSAARHLATTFSGVDSAATQKADYVASCGWLPIFTGKDKAWGDEATAMLESTLKVIDVRGPLFPFDHDMWIGSRTLDIDGGYFIAHLRSETGFPQIQIIEAHRVGTRNGETLVAAGPYKGLRILNGIIYNPAGREVAYRFLADDPAQDRDLSALDLTHVADPKWFSDGRPAPAIASAILDWCDIRETRDAEKIAAKVNSALALIESNATGTSRDSLSNAGGQPVQVPGTSTLPKTEMMMAGQIRYIKAGQGEIKAHTSNRPGDGWLKYDERVEASALRGMGWRAEMFDLSKLAGAGVRGFQDNINTAIHARWKRLRPGAIMVFMRAIAAHVDRRDIRAHPEWDKWDVPPPVEFTVDANKDRQTDVLMVESGFTSSRSVIRRLGYVAPQALLRDQAEHIADQQEIAAEVSKRRGVQIDWRDLGNPKRNPGAGQPQQPAQPDDENAPTAANRAAA